MNYGAPPGLETRKPPSPSHHQPIIVERTPLPGLDDLPLRRLPSVIKYREIEQLRPQTWHVAEFLKDIFNIEGFSDSEEGKKEESNQEETTTPKAENAGQEETTAPEAESAGQNKPGSTRLRMAQFFDKIHTPDNLSPRIESSLLKKFFRKVHENGEIGLLSPRDRENPQIVKDLWRRAIAATFFAFAMLGSSRVEKGRGQEDLKIRMLALAVQALLVENDQRILSYLSEGITRLGGTDPSLAAEIGTWRSSLNAVATYALAIGAADTMLYPENPIHTLITQKDLETVEANLTSYIQRVLELMRTETVPQKAAELLREAYKDRSGRAFSDRGLLSLGNL